MKKEETKICVLKDVKQADVAIRVGMIVESTVKSVHAEGVAVNIELNGQTVSGIISPRCYGNGEERVAALAAIMPGDVIRVVVRSYDAYTRSCSLVLPGYENSSHSSPKCGAAFRDKATTPSRAVKTAFRPEEKGTIFVFDFANICAALPMRVVANAKAAIERSFGSSGYTTLFYLDKKTAGWIAHALSSESAKNKFFSDFRANGNASFVGSYKRSDNPSKKAYEADVAIMQTVAAVQHSVAVSRDGYSDYAEAFRDVVLNRVRGFSVVVLPNESAVLTVEGVMKAVIIPPYAEACTIADENFAV